MSLKIDLEVKEPDTIHLKLQGRLDSITSKDLESKLHSVLATPLKNLVLDFAEVTYISSAGIRIILFTGQILKSKGASFCIVNLQPQIQRVMDAVKALPTISIFQNLEEMDKYLDSLQKEK